MITRREFIQASVCFGGAAIGNGSFGSMLASANSSTATEPIATTTVGRLRGV